VAVIYDPFMDRMYTAAAGKGALMNGEPIRVSKVCVGADKPVIGIVSWPGCPYNILKVAQRLEEQGFVIVSFCSIGYMVAAVATGEFAGTLFPGPASHDSAAGDLIVREAGGVATSIRGKPQTYDRPADGHLFTNGQIHQQVLAVVQEFGELS
jgi:myo-inositol-1(or 4)-monophosphatase